MSDLPLPFFVVAHSKPAAPSEKFKIESDTQFAQFQSSTTNNSALAVFSTIEDAQKYASGRIENGTAIPIANTVLAIEFLGEIQEKCGIRYLLVDDGSHSTTRKALLINGVLASLRATFSDN